MVLLPSDVIDGWDPNDFRTIIDLDKADPNAQEVDGTKTNCKCPCT